MYPTRELFIQFYALNPNLRPVLLYVAIWTHLGAFSAMSWPYPAWREPPPKTASRFFVFSDFDKTLMPVSISKKRFARIQDEDLSLKVANRWASTGTLVQISLDLSNLICHRIEASEPSPEIVADVVTPWILLADLIGMLPILYSSPQYYSVEALEIYYRVHSTILKILEVYEEKSLDNTTINILKIFVERMAESPFMSARLNRPPNVLDRLSVGIVYSGAKFRTSRKTENVGRRGYFENLLAHALSLNFATDSLSNGEGKAPKLVGRPRPFVSASSFL
ncbi:hypothetical protein V9T40_004609 [Parthenolecanium corni]|uniref:Uncharacterized protein n=1 Tax=Parthenolecanium corni TaxID=536013 RepID=A0AAN9TWL6_9HEMI